jgi:hypothetical protein
MARVKTVLKNRTSGKLRKAFEVLALPQLHPSPCGGSLKSIPGVRLPAREPVPVTIRVYAHVPAY